MPSARRALAAGTALVLGLAAAPALRAAEPDPAQTRRIMGEVFAALQQVLPASFDEQRFADPARRAEIQKALDTLARHSGTLAAHGSLGDDRGFSFLASSLARDANEIERRYAAGRYQESRFLLHELTETCVACHSRLPDEEDANLSSRFMKEAEIAALPLPERAQLAMATRQFDEALTVQETMFTSPDFDAGSIDLLGNLDDYLEVCLRVKGDFARPARTLEVFAQRPDVRAGLREDVGVWVVDLNELGARAPIEGLEAGRALVQKAEERAPHGERSSLVLYHTASGTLNRFVAGLPEDDPRAAEAYYWLGVVESRIGRSFWVSQTEPYLEAAIRAAPGDPIAERSYALLEEFVVASYSGSSGEHVPEDVKAWLEELSTLIARAQGEDRS
jgi:hypothetical protein